MERVQVTNGGLDQTTSLCWRLRTLCVREQRSTLNNRCRRYSRYCHLAKVSKDTRSSLVAIVLYLTLRRPLTMASQSFCDDLNSRLRELLQFCKDQIKIIIHEPELHHVRVRPIYRLNMLAILLPSPALGRRCFADKNSFGSLQFPLPVDLNIWVSCNRGKLEFEVVQLTRIAVGDFLVS